MKIVANEKAGIVEIWLSNAEKNDDNVREKLKQLYTDYKAKGLLPVLYLSGSDDLYTNTRDLLLINRNCMAQRAVQHDKAKMKGTQT